MNQSQAEPTNSNTETLDLDTTDRTMLTLLRINRVMKPLEKTFEKHWTWLGTDFVYRHNSPKNFWGRFGGCWQWALGFQISGRSILLHLLVSYLMITFPKKESLS